MLHCEHTRASVLTRGLWDFRHGDKPTHAMVSELELGWSHAT